MKPNRQATKAGNMAQDTNRQWRVARYPEAEEQISTALFHWGEDSIPEPSDGEFLVRTICLAPGPAQRGYLDPKPTTMLEKVELGEVMRGRGVGQIVASRNPDYATSEIFVGSLGWQDYSIQRPRGSDFVFSTKKVTDPVKPLSTAVGILGQAGVTAYLGLLNIGDVAAGDNVLVTAGAGGIGSVAGQIAKIKGAKRVVGTTSSKEKCDWLCNEVGFDAAINYRTENIDERLATLLPDGIDVFFDNVGGDILNVGLTHLAMHARVVICGYISTDYVRGAQNGPINYRYLLARRARMEGFVNFDYWGDEYTRAEQALTHWYREGLLVNTEDQLDGLKNMPDALSSLFTGGNMGIRICRVAPDPA
jgi:NADPH-dependent curcumin reductase CurA